jgi:hypothetical protein
MMLFFCKVFLEIFEDAPCGKRIMLNKYLKIKRESNLPSVLFADIICSNYNVICYNIDEDWVFDVECVARYCQNTPDSFGMRHVQDK